jgi:putative transposase
LRPTRQITPHGTYFVTANTWQRRPLFHTEQWALLFLDTLQRYRGDDKYLLHVYVLMPEHFHLLLTPVGVKVERTVQYIKGGFSYWLGRLRPKLEIWQPGFTEHRIRGLADFRQHARYIHENPVKRKLVVTASEYAWSSAHPGAQVDPWHRLKLSEMPHSTSGAKADQ